MKRNEKMDTITNRSLAMSRLKTRSWELLGDWRMGRSRASLAASTCSTDSEANISGYAVTEA